MVKKSGAVAALLAAGLVFGAPLASATEYKPAPPPKKDDKSSSVIDNRGCSNGKINLIVCNPVNIGVGPLL